MAKLEYNGVELTNVKLTSFVTSNEFEAENFNRTGRKQTLQGIGVLQGAFATNLTAVRDTLSRPGRTLKYRFDDSTGYTTLADGADGSTNYDAKNGPLPEISVTEIAGNAAAATLLVSFTFNWFDCGTSGIQRFEQVTTHTINTEGAVTISRRGFIRVSAGNGAAGTTPVNQTGLDSARNPYGNPLSPSGGLAAGSLPNNADLYRRLIAGVIPEGYQRTRENYFVSQDQLTLAFEIDDTQIHKYIPWPAYDGDGSFDYERSVEGSNVAGVKRLRVDLTGRPGDDPHSLFMACVDVAMARIRFLPPVPDIIQSFKISEPSLFKRNTVGLEITALGTLTSAKFEPSGTTDEWLYQVLFADPTLFGQKHFQRDPYGNATISRPFVGVAPRFRFDPCVAGSTWTQYLPSTYTGSITVVTDETVGPFPLTDSGNNEITKTADNAPDAQLAEDATKIVRYESSQSIEEETNCNFIMPMGWGIQYGFQFALPTVTITQRVTLITRDTTIPIPWPYCGEAFVVLHKTTAINDAPPDASGNRLFAVEATRTVKVSVWNSPNTRNLGGSTLQLADDGGGGPSSLALARAVWSPTVLNTARNPITGANTVNNQENVFGTLVRQDYVNQSAG